MCPQTFNISQKESGLFDFPPTLQQAANIPAAALTG